MLPSLLKRIWPSTWVAGAVVLLSVALPLPQNGKILGLGSPCGLFNLTGIPCPGCGLTRSFVCLGHGKWAEAFVYHPLGPPLFAAFLAYFAWSGWMALRREPFLVPTRLQIGAYVGLAILMLAFWGLRLKGTFPLPESKSGAKVAKIHAP